ncbi:MAG: methyltransferase [Proteobacteria bacterium]|nr:methyltransferase [Pseudomonadota bacterium]
MSRQVQVEPLIRLACACRGHRRPARGDSVTAIHAPQVLADFIRAHTAIGAPTLVPEIRLQLAGEATVLWEATEASLHESGLPPPYWAFAWPGGQALARHVLDHPEIVRGRRVLDFAAGGGLIAIAAAEAGAARITAADIDPFAAAAIGLNAALNEVTVAVTSADLLSDAATAWDVILAGDVCYERPMAERVIAWLRAAAAGGTLVLIGEPGRAYAPRDGIEELARYSVPTVLALEDREIRETRVLRML